MKQEYRVVGRSETWPAGDGTVLQMRPVAQGDAAELVAFVQQLSFGARYFRYGRADFSVTLEQARQVCRPDPARQLHLLILAQRNGRRSVAASGRILFERGGQRCELEMVVGDAWQRRGLGKRLLGGLIDGSLERGLEEMQAVVLVSNTAMVSFLLRRGFHVPEPADGRAIRVARLDLRRAKAGLVAPEASSSFNSPKRLLAGSAALKPARPTVAN